MEGFPKFLLRYHLLSEEAATTKCVICHTLARKSHISFATHSLKRALYHKYAQKSPTENREFFANFCCAITFFQKKQPRQKIEQRIYEGASCCAHTHASAIIRAVRVCSPCAQGHERLLVEEKKIE